MDLKRCKLQKGYITTKKKREYSRLVKKRNQNCVVEKTKLNVGWLQLELPMHILFDILSRLPIKTIFSCKCVCKIFLNILTDRYFAELHLTEGHKVDHCLTLQNITRPSDISLAYSSDLEKPSAFPSLRSDHDSSSCPWRNLAVPPIVSQSKTPCVSFLIGSCNGLLCLAYKESVTSLYICNPILGEFMILPQNGSDFHTGGFGFCPESKLYKVIHFVATSYCEIHTLGTNDWRRWENIPYPDHADAVGSSLNGRVHWISRSSDISKTICSLNLETEQLHFIYPPSHFNRDTIKRMSIINAGEICDSLCVFYILEYAQVEVFVIKEYGVESFSTKKFTVNLKFNEIKEI